jgi:hypothetical protein
MALSLTSPRTAEAREASANIMSPHTSQLENKLFHADIQITSVDDVTPGQGHSTQHDDALTQQVLDAEKDDSQSSEQDTAMAMQTWWDEAAKRNLNLRDGYQNVSVLLIKWADELDELKTQAEVRLLSRSSNLALTNNQTQDLEDLFRNRFHYNCQTVQLNVKTRPQHQLSRHISTFIEDNDGPQNLLIVYYTGHGSVRDPLTKQWLQITATAKPMEGKGFFKDAHASWNKAEALLRSDDVEGDILNIMDCCYASNIVKSGTLSSRKFELLSACGINQTTCSPGPRSFTRVLIDKLTELADEYTDKPFATHILNDRIIRDERRIDTPSHLWFRLPNKHHIFLGPLTKDAKASQQQLSDIRVPRGFLSLRFAISRESLDREQIERLTKSLSTAFEDNKRLGLRKIEWLGFRSMTTTHFERAALAMYACMQWRKLLTSEGKEKWRAQMKRSKEGETGAGRRNGLRRAISKATPTLKRTREDDGGGPAPKQQHLDAGQPLSPPLSCSSRTAEET